MTQTSVYQELSSSTDTSLEQGSGTSISRTIDKTGHSLSVNLKHSAAVFPPAARLVGIELNPGPPTVKIVAVRPAMSSQQPPSGKKKKRAQKAARRQAGPDLFFQKNQVQRRFASSSGSTDVADFTLYKQCLSNPFDYPPVRMGGECMMPTGTATLTLRSIITPGVGQFSMVLWPWATNGNFITLSNAAPYAYTTSGSGLVASFPSGASLGTIANGARIIAAGVRICSIASATNDNGVITVGCLPRESTPNPASTLTTGGFPVGATLVGTQGANEFLNYLQTESYPAKCGASCFYRPQDPLDYVFRVSPLINNGATAAPDNELTPFFVIGVEGASSTGTYILEQILHLEYTVSDAVTGVVNTAIGRLSQQNLIDAAKGVFWDLVDTTIEGVSGGIITSVARAAGRYARGFASGPNGQKASVYSSSDFYQ